MKSHLHLLVSANLMLALLRLSTLPGALSAEAEAEGSKLQGAVAVNSLEDQISNFYFSEEEDAKIKENIERSRYGRMSGKSGKSIPSCTKRLLNDCYHVGRQVRRGYSLPSSVSVRSRGDSGFFREICRDVCDVRIPSEKYRGSSSKSNTSSDIIVRKSDKSDSDFSNVEGASEMEPSKAWDDDYDEDMMDIDTFGGNEDGDGDLLASIIKSSKAGEQINSLALQRACHSAFEFNRVVRRSFARRCANNFGYILESFPTVRRFEEGEEPEEEN